MKPFDGGQLALLRAAELLERDGWCQGALVKNGAFCAMGALHKATDRDRKAYMSSLYRLMAFLGQHHGGTRNIIDWNDQPERTADEVIDALRAAATIKLPSFPSFL
jgi:hypothetical protein